MVKVLNVITNGLKRDGITGTQIEYMKHINKSDLHIDIAAVHNENQEIINTFEELGCNVIIFPDRYKHLFKYSIKLYLTLKHGEYQTIHVHGSSSLMAIELFVAKCAGVKNRIAHSRNTKCVYKHIDKILRLFFYSTYTTALACGIDAGNFLFPNKPYSVFYNGKDFAKFQYNLQQRKSKRDELMVGNNTLLGFVGSLNEQKNPLFLIDILKKLRDDSYNAKLIIIGDGPRRSLVEDYSKKMGVLEYVIFTGTISNVNEIIQAVDIMLLPSLYEGLPNVVLEWQLAGIPSLISNKITEECKVCDLVRFLSIENGVKPWIQAIKDINLSEDRGQNSLMACEAMKEAGFEIQESSTVLRRLYLEGACEQ